jgi:hypothetical protein
MWIWERSRFQDLGFFSVTIIFGFLIISYDTVNQHLQRATIWMSLLTPHLNWRSITDWNCLIGILMWVLELGNMLFRLLNKLNMIFTKMEIILRHYFFLPSSSTTSWFSPFNTMFLWIIIRILILLLFLFGILIIFFLSTHDINFLLNKLLKQQHL